MRQLDLFDPEIKLKAPNVASVPQYSPLRYPGGKTWLYPFAKQWLHKKNDSFLIEAFAGGASIGLAAAIENWVDHVILVDLDDSIFTFWDAMINGHAEWLAKKIITFDFSEENINEVLEKKDKSLAEKAFALLLNNRISHGGIMALGSGRIKNGENGKGLKSRWYPETLQKRILTIAKACQRITVIKDDALNILDRYRDDAQALFFLDPPYTKAGKRLYALSDIDHEKLFREAQTLSGDFLITYDLSDEILNYISKYGFFSEKILMQTTHLTKKYELLITRSPDWI